MELENRIDSLNNAKTLFIRNVLSFALSTSIAFLNILEYEARDGLVWLSLMFH